jgi:replication factor C subunit 1
VSGDKLEFRTSYIPAFVSFLFGPLSSKGQDGIDQVIQFMDRYHFSKDDFDSFADIYMAKLPDIPTAVKSAFTRKYNKLAHPMASTKSKSSNSKIDSVRPDFEDILEEDIVDDDEEEEEEELDGIVQVAKKKGATKSKKETSKPQTKKAAAKKAKK